MPMKPVSTAIVSTAHLSLATREYLDSPQADRLSVARREWGFLISSLHSSKQNDSIPADLITVLSFAMDSGFDYCLFDVDGDEVEELPLYGDENVIEARGTMATARGLPVFQASVPGSDVMIEAISIPARAAEAVE